MNTDTNNNLPKALCKKCGFLGTPELVEPDKFMRQVYLMLTKCPSCNIVDNNAIEWLNYDPDTEEGRENLKKYSKETK